MVLAGVLLAIPATAMASVPQLPASRNPVAVIKPVAARFPPYFTVTSHSEQTRDAQGIVMVAYYGVLKYNPVTIDQVALYYYNDWLATRSATSRATFLKYADWLVANQTSDGLWLYNFPFDGQPAPWWSAMSEGQGISVLVRAYDATFQAKYKTAASLALGTFTRPLTSRGVTAADNGTWYEEYMRPSYLHVLNGMMIAMVGLREYHQEFADDLSQTLWDTGITTLVNNLHRFDTGKWSYYCLVPKHVASNSYHKLHILLLATYDKWTGILAFHDMWVRFEAYIGVVVK
jgi:hypothetical protein